MKTSTKSKSTKVAKPSKSFVKEMQRMYPKGATITPRKTNTKSISKAKK